MLDYKCPSCGGALAFDSSLQKIKCPYCDTQFDVEDVTRMAEEDMESAPAEKVSAEDELSAYVCNSCGGELVTDATTAATSCPYCGNPVVLAKNVTNALRPDCVIPFQLDKNAAVAALKKHMSGKPLLPKVFKDENHIRQIKGVYVPFWLYDASADAEAHFHATRVRTWADSRYLYTKTSHYRVWRSGKIAFSGVPVDGSSKMADVLMESLEPYDISKAVEFESAYLAGYYADRYDVSEAECAGRADARMKESTVQALADTVTGYTSVTTESSSVALQDRSTRYALYPVWLLHTRYRNQDYLFAMNGQTGKLVGDLPMDKGAFWRWWLAVFAIAGIISGLIALMIYLGE